MVSTRRRSGCARASPTPTGSVPPAPLGVQRRRPRGTHRPRRQRPARRLPHEDLGFGNRTAAWQGAATWSVGGRPGSLCAVSPALALSARCSGRGMLSPLPLSRFVGSSGITGMIHLVLFDINNRIFGPYVTAKDRILNSVMLVWLQRGDIRRSGASENFIVALVEDASSLKGLYKRCKTSFTTPTHMCGLAWGTKQFVSQTAPLHVTHTMRKHTPDP
jgi:hypothetical protein